MRRTRSSRNKSLDDSSPYERSCRTRRTISSSQRTQIGNSNASNSLVISSSDEDDSPLNVKKGGKRKAASSSQGANNLKDKKTNKSNTKISLSQEASTSRNGSLSQNRQVEAFQSQGTQKSQAKSLDSEQETDLASKVIKYLLLVNTKKQPIQKSRIVKLLFNGSTRNYVQVMKKVKDILFEIFGYNLVTIDSNKYILTNEIQNSLLHLTFSRSERVQQVLLFIVLAHIFMSGSSCREGTLWQFLENLGIINDDDSDHPYFGNVKQLITTDFIEQQYIERVLADNTDPPVYEFKWGIRAEHELTRRDILEFVSQVYGGRAIKSWPIQYKMMIATEQLNEQ